MIKPGAKAVELQISDDELAQTIDRISLVDRPAMEVNWVALSKEEDPAQAFKLADADQRLIVGLVLVPGRMFLRKHPTTGDPYYAYFKASTVRRLAHKYMQMKRQNEVNVQHEVPVDGVGLVETWLVDDPKHDKVAQYGLSEVATPGTWAGIMKVENEVIWENFIKAGKLNGYSIEGWFNPVTKLSAEPKPGTVYRVPRRF